MRYINLRLTYLLTYLHCIGNPTRNLAIETKTYGRSLTATLMRVKTAKNADIRLWSFYRRLAQLGSHLSHQKCVLT